MPLFRTLINPEQLSAATASAATDWVLLDCRAALSDPTAGQRAFAAGHIGGAQHADLEHHLAAPTDTGQGGRHPLPAADQLAAQCRAWGISDTTQVVTYDAQGGAFAARAWWLLRALGHERVAVLDGGLAHWQQPLERTSPPLEPGNFSIRPSLTQRVDAERVAQARHATSTIALLDARSIERFEGREEPIDPVAGHIPGARCLPHTGNLDEQGRFLSPAALAVRYAGLATRQTICYCGSGVTATHNILAICHAGLPEPALYPGSWSDWIRDPTHPTQPPRAQPQQAATQSPSRSKP